MCSFCCSLPAFALFLWKHVFLSRTLALATLVLKPTEISFFYVCVCVMTAIFYNAPLQICICICADCMRRALALRAFGWGGRLGPLQGLCVWFMSVCACMLKGVALAFSPPRQSRPLLPDGSLLSLAMCLVCECVWVHGQRQREWIRKLQVKCRQAMLMKVIERQCMPGRDVTSVRQLHVASMLGLKAKLAGPSCCLYLLQHTLLCA